MTTFQGKNWAQLEWWNALTQMEVNCILNYAQIVQRVIVWWGAGPNRSRSNYTCDEKHVCISQRRPLALHHLKSVNMSGLDIDSRMNSHTLQHRGSKPNGTLTLHAVAFIPRICVHRSDQHNSLLNSVSDEEVDTVSGWALKSMRSESAGFYWYKEPTAVASGQLMVIQHAVTCHCDPVDSSHTPHTFHIQQNRGS